MGVTPAHMEGQLATEDMRSQVSYEILSVNCVVEILVNVFKLAYTLKALHSKESALTYADFALFQIWLSYLAGQKFKTVQNLHQST